MYDILLLQHFI